MAQQTLNNGETGLVIRGKINDNFSELYTAVAQDPYPEVNTYADLPAATGSGDIYIVRTTTGVIGFRNLAGLYRDAGVSTWVYLGLYGRNAVEIVFVPAGTLSSINVQAALEELDGDIQAHIGSGGTNHSDANGVQSGFMSAANFTKLGGIATGATANATDVALRDRATHTGTQGITSITMNTNRLLGRTTGAAGAVEEIQIGSNLTLSSGVLALSTGALDRANHTGTQAASTISDFTEASQDVVGAMVVAAGGTYDDTAGTVVFPGGGGGYTDEQVRDVMGVALTNGTGINIVVDDALNTITINSTITQYTDENARDALGTALTAGAGITITPNDGADTITVASTITQYTDEQVRDVMGVALVAGTNITITPNDGADTITIAATGGGGGGSGDVVGPASAVDNHIARYDGTTGKLIQDSAASIDDDGNIRTATDSGANVCVVPLVNYLYQNADYALTSTTTEQKLFNQTTNGALDLPTGFYRFKCFFWLTTMSATSGNASFDPVGAGTAVCSDFAYDSYGLDNNTQPNAVLAISGVGSVTQQSGANIVLATTGTGMRVSVQGVFRIDTAGTLIPSIAMVTAAAAVCKAGSHFIIEKIGEASENTVGAWS